MASMGMFACGERLGEACSVVVAVRARWSLEATSEGSGAKWGGAAAGAAGPG